jgi:dUTP pyrophosphatase
MRISLIRNVIAPTRGTEKSAGIDFYVPNQLEGSTPFEIHYEEIPGQQVGKYYIELNPNQDVLIPSGVRADIIPGYMWMAADKSGVSTKQKLIVGAKIIDEDYQGEIGLHVINFGQKTTRIYLGQKLVQLILVPVLYEDVEVVCDCEMHKTPTGRGDKGYGSTGLH